MEDLVRHFSPERIISSPAIFNQKKLTWMNGMYIRQLPQEDLAVRLKTALDELRGRHKEPDTPPESIDTEYLKTIVPLVQDRLKTLNGEEVWDLCAFFFLETPIYPEKLPLPKTMESEIAHTALEATATALEPLEPFDVGSLEDTLRPLAEELSLKTGELFGAIRVAVTGRTAAPPLFDTLAVLGRQRVLHRLRHTIGLLA